MSASLNISYQDSYDINTDGILSQKELLNINIDTGNSSKTTLGSYISQLQSEGSNVNININFGDKPVSLEDNNFQYSGVNVAIASSDPNITSASGDYSHESCYTINNDGNGLMAEQWLKNIVNDLLKNNGVDTVPESMKDNSTNSNTVNLRYSTALSMKDDIIDGNINLWKGADNFSSNDVLEFLSSDETLTDEDIIKYFGDYGRLNDLESMMGLEQGALYNEYSSYSS
ncbi:MAG: hypothetical protein A2Y40_09035 [Candidatus Margulisbacteria bacterium GWF2_35_9]|nr:MAG: hypothetical protein A2Y40_09035 [Candidatus Margulisbacteria bacterium GWF2_35_9]